jgi:hypothetical protein
MMDIKASEVDTPFFKIVRLWVIIFPRLLGSSNEAKVLKTKICLGESEFLEIKNEGRLQSRPPHFHLKTAVI